MILVVSADTNRKQTTSAYFVSYGIALDLKHYAILKWLC